MKLPGRLEATTLGDLLGTLHRERATGVLELVEWAGATAGRAHRIHLNGGLVEAVDSPLPTAPLGEILHRAGFIDGEAQRRLLRRLAEAPLRRSGELLIEERLATHSAVVAALRHQLRSRLDALFALDSVRLRFHVARPSVMVPPRVPLSPREFLHGRARARDRRERPSASSFGHSRPRLRTAETRSRALSVLGLAPTAAPDAVRAAFRRLALEVHPDRHPTATAGQRAELMRRFSELSAAYHALVA